MKRITFQVNGKRYEGDVLAAVVKAWKTHLVIYCTDGIVREFNIRDMDPA